MSIPILTTKLYIPPPRPSMVARPRLIERLNAGRHCKLTLIAAPAGFGKTTLVSNWIYGDREISPCDVAWLSLDGSDNQPCRFFSYLMAALGRVEPEIGQRVQGIIDSSQPPSMEGLMTALINDLATIHRPLALVLDDYHLIQNQGIHQALTLLLTHLPPLLRLIIITRADPPLPLSRLRVRRQMIELRADELRFSVEEVKTFLNEVMQLQLSSAEASALESRTEGWIAGVQLAALSLQRQSDKSGFISSFMGNDRYVVDYLLEEVLEQQPQEIQQFLLQTSVLDRMTGTLCDALTGLQDGQAMLEALEQANLFIVPLDNKRYWYRYHRLFRDLLRHRLRQTQPQAYLALHRRASLWYEQEGLFGEAIEQAFAIDDLERVVEIIERHADTLIWVHNDLRSLLDWLKRLPEQVLRRRPQLCLTQAWTLFELFTYREAEIEALLQAAESTLLPQQASGTPDAAREVASMLAEVDVIRANLARRRNDAMQAIDLSRQALARFPQDKPFLGRGKIVPVATPYILAASYDSLGQMGEARAYYPQAIKLTQQLLGDNYGGLVTLARLMEVLVVQGQLQEAYHLFKAKEPELKKRLDIGVGMLWIGVGEILAEWNQLEAAADYLERGIALCLPFKTMAVVVLKGYQHLARVRQAQGDLVSPPELFQKAAQVAKADIMPYPSARWAAYQARLWIAQGNLAAATRWAAENQLSVHDDLSYLYELDYFTLARLLIAQNNLEEALLLLKRLEQDAQAGERGGRVLESQMLQALALKAQGQSKRSRLLLEKVLSFAQAENYMRLFVEEGAAMASLLHQTARKSPSLTPYVNRLLAAYPLREPQQPALLAPSTVPALQPLLEPLTKRELKTLRLLATDLSTAEIAKQMVVAVSTIRSYSKRIYGKLNVHSRIEAIHRAKEVGLL